VLLFSSSARAQDWERKLEDCKSVNEARVVICASGLDFGGAAARAVCEAQNKSAVEAADKRIEDCRTQVEADRRAQLDLERHRLEEKTRREQAEAAAKAREAEDNPPCLDGYGKCPRKSD
jgi:sRNA-binding protein